MHSLKLISRKVSEVARPSTLSRNSVALVNQRRRISTDDFLLVDKNSVVDSEEACATTGNEKTINSITLLGRVGSVPTQRGSLQHPVVFFSLATNTNYKYSDGQVRQKTEWHRISIFKPFMRESALKYISKGHRVLVQGRIVYGEVKDQEGMLRHTSTIVADDVVYFKNN